MNTFGSPRELSILLLWICCVVKFELAARCAVDLYALHVLSLMRCLVEVVRRRYHHGAMRWQELLGPSWPMRSSIHLTCTLSFSISTNLEKLMLTLRIRVKTRLQVQIKRKPTDPGPLTTNDVHYESALDAIRKIIDDEGVVGLYSGINGSLIGVASTNFAYFYWYSVVRTLYVSSQGFARPLSTATELSLGAMAGAIAQVFTIPVSVVTTRQQTQPKGDKKGLFDTGREVIDSEDGWKGLWRGLKASLVLVVNPAITYGAYQRLKEFFFPGKTSLRPWESFCELSRGILYWLTG